MKSFDAMRRELLRTGGFGVAGAAVPSMTFAAATPPGEEAGTTMQGMFDVRKFGATGDGKTLDTDAVNRAIEAAASAGGGLVHFPAGNYLCFSIHLKSHVHLFLGQGCTIVAAGSPLPEQQTGYNGGKYDAAEPMRPGRLIRTMATTTGTTRSSGARTFMTSASPAPVSSTAKGSVLELTGRHAAIIPSMLRSRRAWATRRSR